MEQSLFWVALAGGEILAVVFILLFIAWLLGIRQKGRDRKAVNELLTRWSSRRDVRKEALKDMLGGNYALSGTSLERAAAELLNAELRLVNIFSQVYLQRMADKAAVFDKNIDGVADAYHQLSGAGQAITTADKNEPDSVPEDDAEATAEEDVSEEDIRILRSENSRLTEELRVTMETMGRMLNEYSTIFSSDGQKEVNVVMDVDEPVAEEGAADTSTSADAPEASAASPVEDVAAAATPPDGNADAITAAEGQDEVPSQTVADPVEAIDLEVAEGQEAASELVDPDEILAAAATTEAGSVVADVDVEAERPDDSDVAGEDEATSVPPTSKDEPAAASAQSAGTGSPDELLEEVGGHDDSDAQGATTNLAEPDGDAVIDDIDALLAASQVEQPGVADPDEAESLAEMTETGGDLNDDLADLFDGEEVMEEDQLDLTATKAPVHKEA